MDHRNNQSGKDLKEEFWNMSVDDVFTREHFSERGLAPRLASSARNCAKAFEPKGSVPTFGQFHTRDGSSVAAILKLPRAGKKTAVAIGAFTRSIGLECPTE